MTRESQGRPFRAAGLMLALVVSGVLAHSQSTTPALPNMGQDLTPLGTFVPLNPGLADHPEWTADHAVTSVVNPLGDTLLVLTSGFNRVYNNPLTKSPLLASWDPKDSTEHVFIYDLATTTPSLKQVVPITNTIQLPTGPLVLPGSTYNGMVFDPTGLAFYVAGGPDDVVHIFTLSASTGMWGEAANSALNLGHGPLGGLGLSATSGGLQPINEQVAVTPCAAGVAISSDGKTLVVANYGNDSITIFNRGIGGFTNWSAGRELDLRPGNKSSARAVRRAGRRISILGGYQGNRIQRHSVCIQRSRPGDRCSESDPAAGGGCPDQSKRPAQQDDVEHGSIAPVCRRRPVGYR